MPPHPLESIQNVAATSDSGFAPPPLPQNDSARGRTISLSVLIDFIIQRTYHELTVLAELLPRKSDLDRKIEIYNYSARTRQLFIRLLALVKWANSASKVDKSSHIMDFLDKQSMLFVDTADSLARMSRDTLVHARLPNFHIPAAIEILTTGTYSRLPTCIREKIIPPDAITPSEKRQTLLRLNQVIQHRLVTGNLPAQMRKFKIENGRVKFHVEHEFEVTLTVMGDGLQVPWRLLSIVILVEDKETGEGKELVHSLQVNYIQQLIQARLVESPRALAEVFSILHSFCQMLQLEVLYTQTLRLMIDRLEEHVCVDEYMPGVRLTVSYWRELTKVDPKSELGYKFTVQTDPSDEARPLAVIHSPSIGAKETAEVADRSVRSDMLSMERLLVHTVYIRTLVRLNDLKVEFQTFLKDVDYHLQGTPAILTVPVLSPCLRAEQLHITVDTHTGMLRCHVPKHLDCPVVGDLEDALNKDQSKLPALVSELRHWVTRRRCEKTLQHLPANAVEQIPLLHEVDQKKAKVGQHQIYVTFHRHPNIVLIVVIKENASIPCEMEYDFHLAFVKHIATDDEPIVTVAKVDIELPKKYMAIQAIVEFDTFTATHGPGTSVDVSTNKRRFGCNDGPAAKQARTIYPAYFIPELAHVVAMCDEKMPFYVLAQALNRRKLAHSGLQVEANSTSLVLSMLTLPMPEIQPTDKKNVPIIEPRIRTALLRRMLSVSVRSHTRSNHSRFWTVEILFYDSPLKSKHHREQGQRRPLILMYEIGTTDTVNHFIDSLLNDWSKVVYLYNLVHDFAEHLKTDSTLQNAIVIKSYSYTNLLIGYGSNKEVTVSIFWCTKTKEYKMIFNGGNTAINAHTLMRDQLQAHLNRHHNLSQIVQIIADTYQPLSSLAKLPIIPQLGIPRPLNPVLTFSILPQSDTLLRISYQTTYCLEVRFCGGGLVSIRDGAYSRFDRSNVVEEFTPTQGLKGFLSKYVDESAVHRRQSQSEDDNPPSPIQMEDMHPVTSPFYNPNINLRPPQSPRDAGLRFQQPHTPPSCSNPHTPASPHTMAQNHPSFSMTSPPGSHIHPSPGGNLMPSSPLNPQQSPAMTAHSPGPNYMQPHAEGSPFATNVMSPAAANWPSSPMPRPSPRPGQSPEHKQQSQGSNQPHISRVIPNRSWAGAYPTQITVEALDTICRPCAHPNKEIPGPELSPLERFLGCVSMRRKLQRFVQTEDTLMNLTSSEPGVSLFKSDLFQCQVFLNPSHMQSLHIKATPLNEKLAIQWSPDEVQTLEQFFDVRVAAPPYRPSLLGGYAKILSLPPLVLKDAIQIMRLDLMPELLQGFKWHVQLCMRVPPSSAPPIVPVGNPALLTCREKILIFLQITRVPYLPGMDWKDSLSLTLPLVHVVNKNLTQVANRDSGLSPVTIAINEHLKRFADYNMHLGECSLFPAVRDLLMNFTLPNEMIPPGMAPQSMPSPMPNQMLAPSPVGASPNPMMHSPMQSMNPQGVPYMGPNPMNN